MGLLEDLFNVGNGVRSYVQDVPGFVGNVLTGDVHGAVTDGRKILGDVGDVLKGAEGLGKDLGVSIGVVPAEYAGTVGKLADSPILAAAQLAIEYQKALTGSGDPEDGNGYRQSAEHLAEAVVTLSHADPVGDSWNGRASEVYTGTNSTHRGHTSDVQAADEEIGKILSTEAGQVSRTRQTLDETSQNLYDYGLATAWMTFVQGLNAAKIAGDTAAAAAALATTDATMWILAENSVENALRIRRHIDKYETAAGDKSGDKEGACDAFVPPLEDQSNLPSRLNPGTPYTVPEPEEPPEYGPPATPYGSSVQPPPAVPPPFPGAPPVASPPVAPSPVMPAGSTPATSPLASAARGPAPTAPSYAAPISSRSIQPTQLGGPAADGARPAVERAERAPVDAAMLIAQDQTAREAP